MASESVASLGPLDFQRETDWGGDVSTQLVSGSGESAQPAGPDIRGLSLPKYVLSGRGSYGYTATFRIPANLTLATGLTFKVYLTDDGANARDLGSIVVIGLTIKRLAANANLDVDSGAAEVTANATLSSTPGGVSIPSIAIANAALPASTAVGDLLLMRIRRVGSSVSDTAPGRAVLHRVEVQNT
jgi:hypothetical protein